jgi:hypothetical protein
MIEQMNIPVWKVIHPKQYSAPVFSYRPEDGRKVIKRLKDILKAQQANAKIFLESVK